MRACVCDGRRLFCAVCGLRFTACGLRLMTYSVFRIPYSVCLARGESSATRAEKDPRTGMPILGKRLDAIPLTDRKAEGQEDRTDKGSPRFPPTG